MTVEEEQLWASVVKRHAAIILSPLAVLVLVEGFDWYLYTWIPVVIANFAIAYSLSDRLEDLRRRRVKRGGESSRWEWAYVGAVVASVFGPMAAGVMADDLDGLGWSVTAACWLAVLGTLLISSIGALISSIGLRLCRRRARRHA
ncbi:hypothetical protein [Candidatus Poriferisodalis sp.]|uniref:hypothetical protein n=1 Tax=Candidatus Poriferisodalis sp. TaxID=3101277 RepID=UPI003B527C07